MTDVATRLESRFGAARVHRHATLAPLTTFKQLGEEGRQRLAKLTAVMREIDVLMREIDGTKAAA